MPFLLVLGGVVAIFCAAIGATGGLLIITCAAAALLIWMICEFSEAAHMITIMFGFFASIVLSISWLIVYLQSDQTWIGDALFMR